MIAADALLALRDEVMRRPPFERANRLAAAFGGLSDRDVAALTLGQRDALLLRARDGAELQAADDCPGCGAALEFTVGPEMLAAAGDDAPRERLVRLAGAEIAVRAPVIGDLAAALRAGDPVRALAERCCGGARLDGAALEAVDAALEALDDRPYRSAELVCPVCAHRWERALDAGAYLWSEIEDWALRLLLDVDLLARTYGWSEAEIVALGPQRRADYVALAQR
jgi:hypothetical protein